MVDKHVVKMILESAQLLSTAWHVIKGEKYIEISAKIYKSTHENHPCAIWVRESEENYKWLLRHLKALIEEYEYRYGKIHATKEVAKILSDNIPDFENIEATIPPCAMGDIFKTTLHPTHLSEVVANYREYYKYAKCNLFYWKKRTRPPWL